MTNHEFVAKLQEIADNYKTVYMWGVFGSPVMGPIIASKSNQYPEWYTSTKQAQLRQLVGKGYFAFDCVNLIKGVLWGWNGDSTKSNGGAAYASAGVPDINADTMIIRCKDVSTDFSKIEVGEAVWMPGHIGVYIGNGKVIEATPSWENKVQVSACANIGIIQGLNSRRWTSHGKLPYIKYVTSTISTIVKDEELEKAVGILFQKGIIGSPAVWISLNKINLKNVPSLLFKMGGIEVLVADGVISNRQVWASGTYTKDNVRSLIIKYVRMNKG
jgi:hypothetical protein